MLGSTLNGRASTPPQFAPDQVLPGDGGAEPSLAIDLSHTRSQGELYVVAISGSNSPDVWHSADHGQTWSDPVPFDLNGPARGSDADVAVGPDGTVYVADLNVSHTWVQTSTDHGKSFDTGTPTTPEADRPWITASTGSTLYVAYHDFASETILVCKSTTGSTVFQPCVDAMPSPGPAAQCAGNTDIGKALRIDPKDGSLNVVFSCSTDQEAAKSPPYGPVHDYFMSKSTDGGLSWTVYPMFAADTNGGKSPTLSNFWTSFVIDDDGNYYALLDGTMDDNDVANHPYHVYLITSKDKGHTWSAPVVVDHESDGRGTHVLSDLAVTSAGQADVVWYGTTATGEPNGVCRSVAAQGACPGGEGLPAIKDPNAAVWRVSMAQSFDALDASPVFTQVPVTAQPTHYGRICTNGIVCGSSDRSLLDFISVVADCTGNAHVAFAGNPDQASGGAVNVHVADQVGGSAIAPPAACGNVPVATPEVPLAPLLPVVGAAAGLVVIAAGRRRRRVWAVAAAGSAGVDASSPSCS